MTSSDQSAFYVFRRYYRSYHSMGLISLSLPHKFHRYIPYVSFVVSITIMLSAGSIYTFSSFSEDFRLRLEYSAKDINIISGLTNAASYIAFLFAGVLYDMTGAQITLLISTIAYGTGHLLIYLTFIQAIGGNVWLMAFYYFLTGIGSSAV